MKSAYFLIIAIALFGCSKSTESEQVLKNPFFTDLNKPIDYAKVTAKDIEQYAQITVANVDKSISEIKSSEPTFKAIFIKFDDISNDLNKASSNCHTLYWVSPDSLSRVSGLTGNQLIDSVYNQIYSDKVLFEKFKSFTATEEYKTLKGHRKKFVDDLIINFELSGIGLEPEKLDQLKELNAEITELTSQYSTNMNTDYRILTLDENGVSGLSENFKNTYRVGENKYEIPAINATASTVMANASLESTRKAFIMEFSNRGVPKNLEILDQLIQKRYEIGQLMGYSSYAASNLKAKMADNPEVVWNFINDLIEKSKPKALQEMQMMKDFRNKMTKTNGNEDINPWDFSYYKNQLLKTKYDVDYEKVREYLPMDSCLKGMMNIYQQLLGYQFKKIENPSVWHDEVELYEVYEGETLRGRFYLDLYPRPNKETWFYGVGLGAGKQTDNGYEVPIKMLLGNFNRPTEELPSLLSFRELNTLFHEFGHIMDGVSYRGEFTGQSGSKSDFVESMSQIFENWIWDYDILSSFAKHYETGETLPKELFDKMVAAKNVTSGFSVISSMRSCTYDMTLYDKYDPEHPISTDDIWKDIDTKIGVQNNFMEGTHPQASWIHINTHPVYVYGYTWSDVYAQDMFTEFEKNGLLDQKTGIRYRDIILANGSQRTVTEAVEEFLGRPSNNEAYIMSLGLE